MSHDEGTFKIIDLPTTTLIWDDGGRGLIPQICQKVLEILLRSYTISYSTKTCAKERFDNSVPAQRLRCVWNSYGAPQHITMQ